MTAIPDDELKASNPSTGTLSPVPGEKTMAAVPGAAYRTADDALIEIYSKEYSSLVRMAASLVSDIDTAEELVQESFVGMQVAWPQLRDSSKALAYVRQSVMNGARSVLRRRMVADRYPPKPEPDAPSAEYSAIAELEQSAVISALRSLPLKQREVLTLRFYLDLREGQIASAMGISRGTVKTHIARGMASMRNVLASAALVIVDKLTSSNLTHSCVISGDRSLLSQAGEGKSRTGAQDLITLAGDPTASE